ncbi:MAG: hypothetical protein ACI965_000657 [Paraglaciecola sp.]|jgi:hypothetical protein
MAINIFFNAAAAKENSPLLEVKKYRSGDRQFSIFKGN